MLYKLTKSIPYLKDIIWLIGDKSIKLGASIAISAIVARYAGIEGFGIINFTLSIAGVFIALSSMGSDHINVSELAKAREIERKEIFHSMLVVRVLWSFIITIVALIYFLYFIEDEYELSSLLFLPQIFFTSFLLISSKLYADNKFKLVSQIGVIASLVSIIARFIFIQFKVGYQYFTVLYSVDLLLTTSLAFFLNKSDLINIGIIRFRNIDLRYLLLCLPTAFSTALVTFYLRLEFFAIEYLFDDKKLLGVWSIVSLFNVPWTILSASILTVFNNKLAVTQQEDYEQYNSNMVLLIRNMLIAGFVCCFINAIGAYFFIVPMFGEEYSLAREIVLITSFSIIPIYMGSVQEIWLAHYKKTKIVLTKVLIGIPLSILLLLLCYKLFGFKGIAIAMVLSYFSTAIFLNIFLAKPFFKLQIRAIIHGR